MSSPKLEDLFTEQAESVQAAVSRASGWDEVVRYAVDLTRRQQGTSLAAVGLEQANLEVLAKLCSEAAIELLTPPLRPHLAEIHTALTAADYGIAETGTLVLDSSSEDLRIATMLSETHVAVLPANRIVADAMDLEPILAEQQQASPRYLAFITGASRTADIERVLAIGVHGPKQLHILITREEPA